MLHQNRILYLALITVKERKGTVSVKLPADAL